uniref:Methyltransferase-like protein 1 isoform X2 n=1 Tax=Rhizophora mucronata TaxID=61149 RepID=A0A2P2J5N5_RHIMU
MLNYPIHIFRLLS